MLKPALVIATIGMLATPAIAQVPPDVQAMIDAAIAKGDPKKVETIIELAKETQPDSAAEIEEIAAAWRAEQAEAKRRAAEEKVEGETIDF